MLFLCNQKRSKALRLDRGAQLYVRVCVHNQGQAHASERCAPS